MKTFKITFTMICKDVEAEDLESAEEMAEDIAVSCGFDIEDFDVNIKETAKSRRKRTKYQVDLDTANPEWEEFLAWINTHDIEMQCVNECGPGAGWPIFRYTGIRSALLLMVLKFWKDPSLINRIEKINE